MYFRLRETKVVEIFETRPILHPDILATLINYNGPDAASIKIGMKWNGTNFDPEFTPQEIAEIAQENLRGQEFAADEAIIKQIPGLRLLITGRPNEIDAFIDANAVDTDSIKIILANIAKGLSLLLKQRFEN